MKSIDIFVTVGDTAPLYIKNLQKSLEHFKSGNFLINYRSIINSNKFDEVEGWKTAKIIRRTDPGPYAGIGSQNHGISLNAITELTDAHFTLIADVDTAVLLPNWDEILISHIRKRTTVVGVGSNKGSRRYLHFPCAIFVMFHTQSLKIVNPDFRPKLVETKYGGLNSIHIKKIESKKDTELWGMPAGSGFRCDTGWTLPAAFRAANYDGYSFAHEEDLKLVAHQPPFEFWYYKGKPFIGHCKNSRKLAKNRPIEWTKFIDGYLDTI